MQVLLSKDEHGNIIEEIVEFTLPIKSLEELKAEKLSDVSTMFKTLSLRPRVTTSLGFDVDGGYTDLTNFQAGKYLGILQVKDADNQFHAISLSDYDTILMAIKVKGAELIQWKWATDEAIKGCVSAEELDALVLP